MAYDDFDKSCSISLEEAQAAYKQGMAEHVPPVVRACRSNGMAPAVLAVFEGVDYTNVTKEMVSLANELSAPASPVA
jgi:hypothetical protein